MKRPPTPCIVLAKRILSRNPEILERIMSTKNDADAINRRAREVARGPKPTSEDADKPQPEGLRPATPEQVDLSGRVMARTIATMVGEMFKFMNDQYIHQMVKLMNGKLAEGSSLRLEVMDIDGGGKLAASDRHVFDRMNSSQFELPASVETTLYGSIAIIDQRAGMLRALVMGRIPKDRQHGVAFNGVELASVIDHANRIIEQCRRMVETLPSVEG